MTTDQIQESSDNTEQTLSELDMLKQRARMMNIEFSNNIGIETLKAKIEAKRNGEPDLLSKTDTLNDFIPTGMNPPLLEDPQNVPEKRETLRQRLVQENMRLIRLRITNMDPKKKDLPGEVFTVANQYLGTVKKFIPYGEVTDDGYHVPYCLYKMLKARKFLNIRTFKDRKNNNEIKVEQNWAAEFALEILPPLTKDELARLGAAQSAAGGLN